MNKGLEVIEAVHLFGIPPERIQVVVHPESIIHSMVEFADNSLTAQLSCPDMRLPIQYALTYPERYPSLVSELDITRLSALTFEAPDTDAFPCLSLAIETAGIKGSAKAVLNGANEAAVERFLRGEIGFYGIYESVREALAHIGNIENPPLGDIIAAGEAAKRFVFERTGK
jgi:1-deoxy-D-xylulose-5-phosphate reductoisomerase